MALDMEQKPSIESSSDAYTLAPTYSSPTSPVSNDASTALSKNASTATLSVSVASDIHTHTQRDEPAISAAQNLSDATDSSLQDKGTSAANVHVQEAKDDNRVFRPYSNWKLWYAEIFFCFLSLGSFIGKGHISQFPPPPPR
jgi:hypothetical protein